MTKFKRALRLAVDKPQASRDPDSAKNREIREIREIRKTWSVVDNSVLGDAKIKHDQRIMRETIDEPKERDNLINEQSEVD